MKSLTGKEYLILVRRVAVSGHCQKKLLPISHPEQERDMPGIHAGVLATVPYLNAL
jgi:hypothetical protein